jgi:hypothetical protein
MGAVTAPIQPQPEIDPQKSVTTPRTIAWMRAKVEWSAPNSLLCTRLLASGDGCHLRRARNRF